MCQHRQCTLTLDTASQALHILHQYQPHHWACSSGLLPSWPELSCPASMSCLSYLYPCAVQDGVPRNWV